MRKEPMVESETMEFPRINYRRRGKENKYFYALGREYLHPNTVLRKGFRAGLDNTLEISDPKLRQCADLSTDPHKNQKLRSTQNEYCCSTLCSYWTFFVCPTISLPTPRAGDEGRHPHRRCDHVEGAGAFRIRASFYSSTR